MAMLLLIAYKELSVSIDTLNSFCYLNMISALLHDEHASQQKEQMPQA